MGKVGKEWGRELKRSQDPLAAKGGQGGQREGRDRSEEKGKEWGREGEGGEREGEREGETGRGGEGAPPT